MKNSIKANSKAFWSYVNGLKKPGEEPSEMYFKETKAKYNQDIADLFSERFSEVFPAPLQNSNLVFNSVIAQDSFWDFQFNHAEVFKNIMSLDNSFSSGADAIPATLVKQCARVLTQPLSMLFRRSLDAAYFPSTGIPPYSRLIGTGEMPRIWKSANNAGLVPKYMYKSKTIMYKTKMYD